MKNGASSGGGALLADLAFALYRGLWRAGAPLAALALAERRRRGREDAERLGERHGIASQPRPPGPLVWLHASSVGESLSALALLDALRETEPKLGLLMTSGTVTSARLMAERLPRGAIHQYLPIDAPTAVARFFDHWRPDLGLVIESELWPNLILAAHARAIPLALINGRMSARSFRSWGRWRPIIGRLLQCFALVLAQSPEDAKRFAALGAKAPQVPGNLKFAAAPPPADPAELARVEEQLGERPRWLAASTHPGEERLVAAAQRELAASRPGLLAILVPRHPQRGAELATSLSGEGFAVALRSRGETPAPTTALYIADTIGELGLWYRLAPVAFVGGSLVPHGGQNPLEAAKLGSAIVTGPHTENFARIAGEMERAGALTRVTDGAALGRAVARLLDDEAARKRQIAAAADYARHEALVLERTLAALEPLLAKARKAEQSGGN